MSALLETARAWLAQDPDEETRAELESLIAATESGDEAAEADLADRFNGRLAFGTAGLRGRIEAGSNRMNRVLVSQAAAGIAAYLNLRERDDVPSVVLGYDGRKNSKIFAEDSAEIFTAAGIRTFLLPRALPTPVLAYAVRHLGTSAGVMVTASHNPPADNGYKVYLGEQDHGSQIVSPTDALIAEQITLIADTRNVLELPRSTDYEIAPESVIEAYVAATAAIIPAGLPQQRVVYTAMHGVGWETFAKVVTAGGLDLPTPVLAQRDPDAAFPTVSFPNPEEVGALDLAYELGREIDADLIVANDPDADRFSVAIPDSTRESGFRQLSGNEVGWLLGWQAARQAAESETHGALATTIVSSPALSVVAEAYGLDFSETLTGFKWVSRVPELLFGYEEAIGYLVNPGTVRDKDGISAAAAFLTLAGEARAAGRSVGDLLTEFTTRFGFFGSDQLSIRVADLSRITRIMASLREHPPTALGGSAVLSVEDLLEAPEGVPGTDALRFSTADGSRVMARPSGTEPKLKFYIDVHAEEAEADTARAALVAFRTDLAAIAEAIA